MTFAILLRFAPQLDTFGTDMKKMNKLRHQPTNALFMGLTLLFCTSIVEAAPLLNGVATHSELGTEQFIGGLYTSTLSTSNSNILSAQEDKRLQVRVLTDQLSSRRFKRMWIEGMAINSSPAELERHAKNMATFSNLLKVKMIAGDILSVDRTDDVVRVSINDTTLGEIDDPQFFDLLLRTWIGPVPLSSDFRGDLLVAGSIKPGPLSRFESTRPTEERIAAIEQAVSSKLARDQEAQKEEVAIAKPSISAPTSVKNEPQIKPQISAPRSAATAASAAAGATAGAAADLASQEDTSEPANESKEKLTLAAPKVDSPQPQASPKPKKVALAPKQQELDLSIFDEEDDEVFTAEGLLKQQLYYSQLTKYTNRFLKYPARAWDRGQEGSIRLRVTIDRKGEVKATEILEEAKYKVLNKEAESAVKRASPYPAMPDELRGDDYSFNFTVTFKIVDQK